MGQPVRTPSAKLFKPRKTPSRVLWIDLQIPMPDRDSGSVRAIHLLRVLKDLGCQVSFAALSTKPQPEYAKALQQMGVEVLEAARSHFVQDWLQRHGDRLDHVILSRLPVAEALFDRVRAMAPSARIIFDTVDLHWLREERQARLSGDPEALEQALLMKGREISVTNSADETWVVSPAESGILRNNGCIAPVKVISNIVDICPPQRGFDERSGFLFIGSFRHRPNVDAVEYFMTEIYPLLPADLHRVPFYIIGENPPESIARFASEQVMVTGHLPSVEESFEQARLSVAPLRFGAGVKGKINQSMAHGVPVIASPIAAEGMDLDACRELPVCASPTDFARTIASVYHDRERWQTLSTNGLVATASRYGMGAVRAQLERLVS
jgi:O-antigen biosynthesis protein